MKDFNKYALLWIGIPALLGILFVMVLFNVDWKKQQTTPQSIDSEQLGKPFEITLDAASAVTLPSLSPDQETEYAKTVRKAWKDAVAQSPQHIVTFPNDPYLLGFRVLKAGATEYTHYVVDIRKPILVDIAPATEPLPNNKTFMVEVEVPEQSYQLTVRLRHTADLQSLDLEQLVAQSFQQIISAQVE